jgi:hypothetical protein
MGRSVRGWRWWVLWAGGDPVSGRPSVAILENRHEKHKNKASKKIRTGD